MLEDILENEEQVFGEKLQNVKYIDRIGVYGVIINNEDKIAVLKTETGYFYIINLQCNTSFKIEEGKELIWIDSYECMRSLPLEHQSWAVSQAIK